MAVKLSLLRSDRIIGVLDSAENWDDVSLHAPIEASVVGDQLVFKPLTDSAKFFGLLVSKDTHIHDGTAEVYKLITGYKYNGIAKGALSFGDVIKPVVGGFAKWVEGTDDAKLAIGEVVTPEGVANDEPFEYTAGGQ